MLDLDLFKTFNDKRGHLVGDRVLQVVATRLQAQVRWPELVTRYGGEEFIVVLPGCSLEIARERAEALRCAIEVPFEVEGQSTSVTISIGVALLGTENPIRDADRNLQLAKERGRNQVAS